MEGDISYFLPSNFLQNRVCLDHTDHATAITHFARRHIFRILFEPVLKCLHSTRGFQLFQNPVTVRNIYASHFFVCPTIVFSERYHRVRRFHNDMIVFDVFLEISIFMKNVCYCNLITLTLPTGCSFSCSCSFAGWS